MGGLCAVYLLDVNALHWQDFYCIVTRFTEIMLDNGLFLRHDTRFSGSTWILYQAAVFMFVIKHWRFSAACLVWAQCNLLYCFSSVLQKLKILEWYISFSIHLSFSYTLFIQSHINYEPFVWNLVLNPVEVLRSVLCHTDLDLTSDHQNVMSSDMSSCILCIP